MSGILAASGSCLPTGTPKLNRSLCTCSRQQPVRDGGSPGHHRDLLAIGRVLFLPRVTPSFSHDSLPEKLTSTCWSFHRISDPKESRSPSHSENASPMTRCGHRTENSFCLPGGPTTIRVCGGWRYEPASGGSQSGLRSPGLGPEVRLFPGRAVWFTRCTSTTRTSGDWIFLRDAPKRP